MNRLERKVLIPWIAASLLVAVFLTGLSVAVQGIIWEISPALTAALLVLFTVTGILYSVARFRAWGFELRENYLYIEKGVLKKVKTKVPYVRVQHIDTERGPVYRIFGLSKLVVYTAGSRGADVSIPGLLPGRADEIQERLRKVAATEDSGDAV
jgi:membrane protein YdbS with pleckstrin-like domain